MSMKLMASVMDLDLPGNEKIVLMTLARFADDSGNSCHPSIELIASRAGVSSRSARRMVRALQKRGMVDVAGHGRGDTYRYYLRYESAAWTGLEISHSEAKERLREAESYEHSKRSEPPEVPDNLSATGAGNTQKVPDNLSEVPDNLSASSGHSVPQSSHEADRCGSEAVNAPARDADLEEAEAGTNPAKPEAPAPAPKSVKPKARPKPRFTLPDWVPADAWNGWLEMRRRKKSSPTDRAKALAIGQLEKLWADGQDPGAVLDQSTMHGWTGIFPLRGDERNGNTTRTGSQPQYRRNPGFEMLRDAIREERELQRLGELPPDLNAQADYLLAGHPLSLPPGR